MPNYCNNMSKKKITPRLSKGTRDFLPEEVSKRQYLFDTIEAVFRVYGFQRIETPAVERMETLSGKYGDEGDRLLFGILNSGDFLSKVKTDDIRALGSQTLRSKIAEKGLRYDLTVPLARYVVQHQHELTFPFRRYHMAPVWRADRPQKGRYQEFYQCDADIIGMPSAHHERELTEILLLVFQTLNIPVEIHINHRAILEGIVQKIGLSDQYQDILISIDKLDKAGEEKVRLELAGKDIAADQIEELFRLFGLDDLSKLAKELEGNSGIAFTQDLLSNLADERAVFSPALARGLDYYTGTIWEVKPVDIDMGTVAAGGRYDDLTTMFGGQHLSGVGISFGVERIYDILEEVDGFPSGIATSSKVLFVNFGGESEAHAVKSLKAVRKAGIAAELYPVDAKLKKQMTYADRKSIPFVVFIGDDELASGGLEVKEMSSGEQQKMTIEALIAKLA